MAAEEKEPCKNYLHSVVQVSVCSTCSHHYEDKLDRKTGKQEEE